MQWFADWCDAKSKGQAMQNVKGLRIAA